MMNSTIIERLAEESPTSLMVQGLMEHLFSQANLDTRFEEQAQAKYTRDLLESSGLRPSTVGELRLSAQSEGITGESDDGL